MRSVKSSYSYLIKQGHIVTGTKIKIIALSQAKDEATWSREGPVANVTCILKLEPKNLPVCQTRRGKDRNPSEMSLYHLLQEIEG